MINIYLTDNNLYCASKSFFADSRSLNNLRQIRDILQLTVNLYWNYFVFPGAHLQKNNRKVNLMVY